MNILRISLMMMMGCAAAFAQPQPVVLTVEVENSVMYFDETGDPRDYASTPERRTVSPAPQNTRMVHMADIVSINGKPAKGVRIQKGMQITYRPDPLNDQQAIADVFRSSVVECHYEMLSGEGTLVGHIMTLGHNSGPIAPGMSTAGGASGSWAVVGGTGAFMGIHGQSAFYPGAVGARFAPMSETGKLRRINGGGSARYLLYLYPAFRPEVVSEGGRPMVFHSDFTPVDPSHPARAGETLIVRAKNLGPTKVFLPPGQVFPADTPYEVNSPLNVTINGRDAEVINGIGWPGTTDHYRVDVRIPAGVSAGIAAIELTAAWIPGPVATIPVGQ